jgi:hypothetical protein
LFILDSFGSHGITISRSQEENLVGHSTALFLVNENMNAKSGKNSEEDSV